MKSAQEVEKRFDIFSPEAKLLFEKAQLDGDNVFLFGARKGLYPTTICGDCGTVVSCDNCGAPVVLHESHDKRRYICHACGKARGADTFCSYCHSWNLVPLGIGIDKIAEDLRKHYRSEKIFILDKDHAPTAAQARKIAKEFLSTKGAVLIGTELAFLYIDKVPYTCAVSLDPLFSIPDFGVNEKIFYIATHIIEMSTIGSIIQTRNIKKQILAWASTGNILDFYKAEIQDRESFLYSPFSIFIKVTLLDKPSDARERLEMLEREFKDYKPDFVGYSMIIRVSRNKWPLSELAYKLSLLPPDFLIKVDPESIL
jgi:primosomal protein N' (replication factor Y)